MAPSMTLRKESRPGSQASGSNYQDEFMVPNRTSSLHSRIAQPSSSSISQPRPAQRAPKTLTHAYMVCGVGREPSQWVKAPQPAQGRITHMKNAVGQFWLPEILGSSPRLEQDNSIARSLHAAMRACFPHNVEICTGNSQPHCIHHAFVLQQDSSHTLYGIALRVWSRADEKRVETIRELRRKSEPDFQDNANETYWIPYCLSFLSRYPLYNLLGDYLRGMWIHWNKATNLFHAEEVSRILSFPAPKLQDLVRIDMKDYALCYHFPSSPTGFQNFALWPLFACLSVPNLVGVAEAAVSPASRIIFVSHYPAMLTLAAETLRFCVRVYEWSGLYVPIVHAQHVGDLVQDPGPYILGVTSECRSLFTAPGDAMIVDLDKNYVLTSNPPATLSKARRGKTIERLSRALGDRAEITGVPHHLRSAYGGGKLIPAGEIIAMRGEVERITEPTWWKQEAVMPVFDKMCEKAIHNRSRGMKAMFASSQRRPQVTSVSTRHLNELIRERNQYSRDALEAWQDFINLKVRMDNDLAKVSKRNNFLVDELESWKQQFLKFQAFAEQLTKQTTDLRLKIDGHKMETQTLNGLIEQHKDELARSNAMLNGTEKQRDDALEALVLQQEIAEELERERKRNKKELASLQQNSSSLSRQRDEAQRVVLHLRALIDGQAHHMEHIVQTLNERDDSPTETSISPDHATLIADRPRSTGADNDYADDYNKENMQRLEVDDPADKSIRDKTDAIAYIIRNISEQCAAAVEGLQLAHRADVALDDTNVATSPYRDMLAEQSYSEDGTVNSEYNDAMSEPSTRSGIDTNAGGSSSIPPTPELVSSNQGFRSSTVSSHTSINTIDARQSSASNWRMHVDQDIPEMPTMLMRAADSGVVVADLDSPNEHVSKLSAHNLEAAQSMTLHQM